MRVTTAALLLTTTVACVSTKTTAVRSSEYEGAHFKGALVFVNTGDLEKRRHYEDVLVQELAAKQIRARASLDLFPPMDAVTPELLASKSAAAGLDTELTVQVLGEAHETVVTGQHTNANCYGSSNGTATAYGNSAYYSGTSSANCSASTHNTTRSQHALGIEFRLVEIANGKVIWMAQSQGQGGAGGLLGRAGVGSDLIEHMAGDVSSQIASAALF